MAIRFEGFKYVGVEKGVCSEEPIILGTRLRAGFIATYGTVNDVLETYDQLSSEQVKEAKLFVQKLDEGGI